MKVFLLLLCLGGGPAIVFATAKDTSDQKEEAGVVTENPSSLTPAEQAMLEELVDHAIAQEELLRSRRSGLIKKKSDKINRLSSLEHPPSDHYGPPEPLSYGTKSFSLWSFKKAILNALIQAVKAITGGVLALKGQLVKVKGHIVAAKGKLLETKGDAITEFGKHLATKALLTPVHLSNYDHSGPAHGPYPSAGSPSYGPPAHHPPPAQIPPPSSNYGAPSYGPPSGPYPGHAPPSSYGAPPPPSANSYLPPSGGFGSEYIHGEFPPTMFGHQLNNDFGNHHLKRDTIDNNKGSSDGLQAGIVVLKPINLPQAKEQDSVYRPPQAFSTNVHKHRRSINNRQRQF
ncbi:formin-G [Cimex lectularius]|uniref:Uncharacterized protein n=1 Tax=Cimex lectularius TaxID=79782 RepID=A0A8I6TFE4_CIMLE|nr:formin-G [Cimex lectularius]XP_014251977.1 formin-G [Cimex lectularius]